MSSTIEGIALKEQHVVGTEIQVPINNQPVGEGKHSDSSSDQDLKVELQKAELNPEQDAGCFRVCKILPRWPKYCCLLSDNRFVPLFFRRISIERLLRALH